MRMLHAILPLALLAFCLPAAAQSGPFPNQPQVGPPKAFSLPRTQDFTLPNGMQVTLIPSGLAPKTSMMLRIEAGNLDEHTSTWLADLTGEMLKQGAGGRSAGQIADAAAAMGGALNVGVSWSRTDLSIAVLQDSAPAAIALLSDVARRPDFAPDAFARARQDLVRNLAVTLARAQPVAGAVLAKAIYGPTHPYGRVLPDAAQLNGYRLDDVRSFYDANYGAKRAHLYVAGQFDAQAIRAAVMQAFGDWAPGPEALSLAPQPALGPGSGRRVLLVDRPGAPQSTLQLAFSAPMAGAPGDIGLRVTDALLSGAFNSRITTNIREEKGYTYSPGSSIGFRPGDAVWTFEADVASAVTGAALHEVFKEITGLQAAAPPLDEASGMSTWLSGVFVLQNASPGGLIRALAQRDALDLSKDWLDAYVPAVLSIQPQDIEVSAKSVFTLDGFVLVIVGDLKTVAPQVRALRELKGAKFIVTKLE